MQQIYQDNIPPDAIGIKLVPMEQAAQPGWRPEPSPGNMDAWVSKHRVVKLENSICTTRDDNATYTCAHMLLKLQQQIESEKKEHVLREIHEHRMKPSEAYAKYGQPSRYTMPALAVLYDANRQPNAIYIPSWSEVQIDMMGKTSGAVLPADVDNKDVQMFMQSRIKAFDTQYQYPLPENYTPPLMSNINKDTQAPVVYEHYGNTRFDPTKTGNIGTCRNLKPMGGLWACAQNEDQSWSSFLGWGQPEYRDDNKFAFSLSSDAKILKIDSIEAIAYLQQHYPQDWSARVEYIYLKELFQSGVPALMVDWQQVSQDYDGIYYSVSELWNAFGPYDVNSLCVFNPDVVIEQEQPNVLHIPMEDVYAFRREMLSQGNRYIQDDIFDMNNDEHYFFILYKVAQKFAYASTTPEQSQYYTALGQAALASFDAIQNHTDVPLYDPKCIAELNAMSDEIGYERTLLER